MTIFDRIGLLTAHLSGVRVAGMQFNSIEISLYVVFPIHANGPPQTQFTHLLIPHRKCANTKEYAYKKKASKISKRAAINFHKSDWWIWSWHSHCHQEERKKQHDSTLLARSYNKYNNSILLHAYDDFYTSVECSTQPAKRERDRVKKCIRQQPII